MFHRRGVFAPLVSASDARRSRSLASVRAPCASAEGAAGDRPPEAPRGGGACPAPIFARARGGGGRRGAASNEPFFPTSEGHGAAECSHTSSWRIMPCSEPRRCVERRGGASSGDAPFRGRSGGRGGRQDGPDARAVGRRRTWSRIGSTGRGLPGQLGTSEFDSADVVKPRLSDKPWAATPRPANLSHPPRARGSAIELAPPSAREFRLFSVASSIARPLHQRSPRHSAFCIDMLCCPLVRRAVRQRRTSRTPALARRSVCVARHALP